MPRHQFALVLIALGFHASIPGFAKGPLDSEVADTVLSRLNEMGEDVAAPFQQALCARPGETETGFSLRPDGIILSGELDLAKLLSATRAIGLSTSLSGFIWISHAKGEDHVSAHAYLMPSAGFNLPGVASAGEAPVNAQIGVSFNCANNLNPSDYLLEIGAGGPAGLNFFFDISLQNLMMKAMLSGDPTNAPRTYEKIMSTARSTEPALRAALDESERIARGLDAGLAGRLLSTKVPRWHDGEPVGGSSIAHWLEQTAEAARLTAKPYSSAENLTRRVESFLARLKQGARDDLERAQFHVDIGGLYLELGQAVQTLALATFPLTMRRDSRALFEQATSVPLPRDFWFTNRPLSNFQSQCRSSDHFIAVDVRVGGKRVKHYYDCRSGVVLSEAQLNVVRAWFGASRRLVEAADRYRAALWDLVHVANNTFAQHLTGQAVRPEKLTIGGVHTGPIFTGCFGVEVSLVSLAQTGAALLRYATGMAGGALARSPQSAAALVSSMGAGAGGIGLPDWTPSANLGFPYPLGEGVEIPLSSMPRLWRTVFAGRCD